MQPESSLERQQELATVLPFAPSRTFLWYTLEYYPIVTGWVFEMAPFL
jgi:hypothetical protein